MGEGEGSEKRKFEILKTFARMVADRGYDEVSFRLIAEELNISKGTIVEHYGAKDRLLETVHREYMVRRLREAHIILERIEAPAEQLVGLIAQLLLAQRDDRSATIAFAREIVRFSALDHMKEVRGMRREYTHLLRDVIERGMKSGAFRQDNAELITLQIFGMCNWSWTWLLRDRQWPVDEIVQTGSATIRSCLSPRPG